MGVVYVIAWFNMNRMYNIKIIHIISTAKVTELIKNAIMHFN